MTGIVLAGGKATRMGGSLDKAFLKINDEPIIMRQLKVLKRIFEKVMIVANSQDRYKDLEDVELVRDIIPDRGPLGGIYSGLVASSARYNFVVACDMPFINEILIRYMVESRDDYDVVIPKTNEKFHPLFGIYSKDCIPVIEEMLKHDRLKISNIFTKVRTHFILKNAIEKFDEELLSLVNINTKKDLAIANTMPSDHLLI